MDNINGYIMTYVNPDSDGVCTSIVYAKYLQTQNRFFEPIFFGNFNAETKYILEKAGIKQNYQFNKYDQNAKIILIDTHHLSQLSYLTNPDNVIEVIDHHPSGNAKELKHAKIINENIGAAATILGKIILKEKYDYQKDVATLICSAIISNTLNFTAPSTTEDDISIFKVFNTIAQIDEKYIQDMFKNKDIILNHPTKSILESDLKIFSTCSLKYGITQIEVTNSNILIHKNDLLLEMNNLSKELNIDFLLLSIIDILKKNTYVISCNSKGEEIINKIFTDTKKQEFFYYFDRVLLRKTDFVKQIEILCIGE